MSRLNTWPKEVEVISIEKTSRGKLRYLLKVVEHKRSWMQVKGISEIGYAWGEYRWEVDNSGINRDSHYFHLFPMRYATKEDALMWLFRSPSY